MILRFPKIQISQYPNISIMKALEQKVILYDEVCPLCQAYTAGFTRLGWLQHRQGFAGASPTLLQKVDLLRGRHEIPLHDLSTGETVYGLDALFLILGTRFPPFQPLFRWRPFRAVLQFLYNLISYNRRIIAGTRPPATGFDCGPDRHPFYQTVYIFLALTAGLALAWPLVPVMAATPAGAVLGTTTASLFGVMLVMGGFVPDRLTYMGHWSTVFLITMLPGRILPEHWISWGVMAVVAAGLWWRRGLPPAPSLLRSFGG
jgi:predicted DCC family thiol-disulfide oxidoreductase YuxK